LPTHFGQLKAAPAFSERVFPQAAAVATVVHRHQLVISLPVTSALVRAEGLGRQ